MLDTTTIHELLAGIARALPGVGIVVRGGDGAVREAFGEIIAIDAPHALRMRMPGGEEVIGAFGNSDPARRQLLATALQLAAKCEQLEQDMESMNHSSMQLLEQVAMLGETLPRLSAAESETEIATTGLLACAVATSVQRALYVRCDARTKTCEVLVHVEVDARGRAAVRPYPKSETVGIDGCLLAEVFRDGGAVVLRTVDSLGVVDPDSPESLAVREVLGAAITCDDGDRRVVLGALLLFDKVDGGYGDRQARLGSEERQVAVSFASMLGAVIGARQSAELGKELSMAQAIQAQILPASAAAVSGFDLAGDYRTSGEVGGDYFDYVPLADGRTLAVVADVSGHNLASGMMMVSARATLRTLAAVRSDAARLFQDLASGMFTDLMRTERFITAAGVALRAHSGEIEVVSAGHNDILLYRAADGSVTKLQADSTVFGFVPDAEYECKSVQLQAGDCLLLYTDGVTEATNGDEEMFGEDRLAKVLAATASGSSRAIVAAVLAQVDAFREPGQRGDDVTVVAIKKTAEATGKRA